MMRVVVMQSAFAPETEVARFTEALDGACGALVTFTGYCRARSSAGAPVETLELDHYPGFTEAELERMTRLIAGAPTAPPPSPPSKN
jgi:molybdopterin synthase catalytic subunit